MFVTITRCYHSIVRWGQSHGFGVQSPSAYRFVKDVARQSWPYYGYASLYDMYPEKDVHFLALHRFLLRFSNFMQGKQWAINGADEVDLAYIKAGASKALVSDISLRRVGKNSFFDIKEIGSEHSGGGEATIRQCSAVVVKDIHLNDESKRLWAALLKTHEGYLTFDLYDCGVVFLDTSLQGGNYNVMLKA